MAKRLRLEAEVRVRANRARYWDDPAAYCREVLDITPTDEQLSVLRALRYSDSQFIAVKAANGTGKTHIAAAVVVWWMDCAPRELPNGQPATRVVYTTAPTFRQVVNNLWKEIRARVAGARPRPGGTLMPKEPRWDQEPGSFAQGFSTTDQENIKGQHAPYLLIVVDEAQGVDAAIFEGLETMLKGKRARLLLIGNASQVSGEFYEAFHDKSALYETLTIAARSHPNVLSGLDALGVSWEQWRDAPFGVHTLPDDFEDPIPGAVSLYDLERYKISFGVGTPAWDVIVEGAFPESGDRSLIWLTWVDAARRGADQSAADRDDYPLALAPLPSYLTPLTGKWAGCDVARFGNDRTVLVKFDGPVCESVEFWQGHELHYTAGKIVEAVRDGYKVVYDEGGLGAGLTSHFDQDKLVRPGIDVFKNVPGGKPDPQFVDQVPNMRDQLWISGATYLRQGHVDLSRLSVDQFRLLKGELTAVEYDLDSKSRRTVESKDKLSKRIGRSPDVADAFNLALWRPAAGGTILVDTTPYGESLLDVAF